MPSNITLTSQDLPSGTSASVLLSKGVKRLELTLKLTTAISRWRPAFILTSACANC